MKQILLAIMLSIIVCSCSKQIFTSQLPNRWTGIYTGIGDSGTIDLIIPDTLQDSVIYGLVYSQVYDTTYIVSGYIYQSSLQVLNLNHIGFTGVISNGTITGTWNGVSNHTGSWISTPY